MHPPPAPPLQRTRRSPGSEGGTPGRRRPAGGRHRDSGPAAPGLHPAAPGSRPIRSGAATILHHGVVAALAAPLPARRHFGGRAPQGSCRRQ
eukprot:4729676-Lingulodinium_polyedra.AAC.1